MKKIHIIIAVLLATVALLVLKSRKPTPQAGAPKQKQQAQNQSTNNRVAVVFHFEPEMATNEMATNK